MVFYERKACLAPLLPQRLREVAELAAICAAAGGQIDEANLIISKAAGNSFIKTADIDGLLRWEKMLGVSAPLDSSVQARRDALVAKLMTKPPINLSVLKSIIEAYMGLEVDITVDGYVVRVSYRGESRISDLAPLLVTVYDVIPADMLLEISYRYLIWSELDSLALDFDGLDAEGTDWEQFEKGEWIDG